MQCGITLALKSLHFFLGNDIRKIVKGSFDIYGQYHFNMETQYCSVIPTEDSLDIYPSTQWMDINQAAAAAALKVPANRYYCLQLVI